MAIKEEPTNGPPVLATSREPVAAKGKNGKPASVGDQALQDSVILILVCWALLFLLVLSLRSHNI